jgi:hypothetical protein
VDHNWIDRRFPVGGDLLKFGVIAYIFSVVGVLGFQGVFNLPVKIWLWWSLEAAAYLLVGGMVLGWIAQKLSPART